VFLPRRKEGEDPSVPRHISVSYEALVGLFHLPLNEAAREIGLCPTTFKKACRRFDLETWPFRKGGSSRRAAIARRQTDGVDAVEVSCTSPVWHGGPSSPGGERGGAGLAGGQTVAGERGGACSLPEVDFEAKNAAAASSSATPQGLLQQLHAASMALDTRSLGEASEHLRSSSNVRASSFQRKTFAPHDAPSYIDAFTRGRVVNGVPLPMPEGRPTTGACGMAQGAQGYLAHKKQHPPGGATPLEAGPPGEKSCTEAVMEYLDLGCSISEADVTSMLSDDY